MLHWWSGQTSRAHVASQQRRRRHLRQRRGGNRRIRLGMTAVRFALALLSFTSIGSEGATALETSVLIRQPSPQSSPSSFAIKTQPNSSVQWRTTEPPAPPLGEFRPVGQADVPPSAWTVRPAQPPSRSRVTFVVPSLAAPPESAAPAAVSQQPGDRNSDLLTRMSTVCTPAVEDTYEVRAKLSAAATPDVGSPRVAYRTPAVFRPAEDVTDLAPQPIASDRQLNGDLLGGLSALPAVPMINRKMAAPPASTPVVADRQAEELAKSLGLASPAPHRSIAPRTTSSVESEKVGRGADLLASLSAIGSRQEEKLGPQNSASAPNGEQVESLARSFGPTGPSQRDRTTIVVRPFTSEGHPNSDDDLLARLSTLPAKQPKTRRVALHTPAATQRPAERVAESPITPSTAPARPSRFAATPRQLPDYFGNADDGGDDLLEKLMAVHSERHESHLDVSPPQSAHLADDSSVQDVAESVSQPPIAAPEATPPARNNKWLAMLPSFQPTRGVPEQGRSTPVNNSPQQPVADASAVLAQSQPLVNGSTAVLDQGAAPAPARGLVSHLYVLRFSPPASEVTTSHPGARATKTSQSEPAAVAAPTIAATDSTPPTDDSIVDTAPTITDRIAANEAVDTAPAEIELPQAVTGERVAANDTNAIAAMSPQPQAEAAAQPPASVTETMAATPPAAVASERLSELPSSTNVPTLPVAQLATAPSVVAGPSVGPMVVVVVGSPQGPSEPIAPSLPIPQTLAAAQQPVRPLGIPEFPIVPESTYLNESVLAAGGYMPMRLAMQPVAPSGEPTAGDATLPTPPQNGQAAAAAPGGTATKPNGEADTIAGAEKLGDEPVNNELQFLRRETVLLKPGDWQVDIGLVYSYQQNDVPLALLDGGGNISDVVEAQVRQRELFIPFAFRYGWTKKTQLFINVPVGWANTELDFVGSDETENDGGVGDITFGFTHLCRSDECRDIVFTFATTAPTGDSPFGPAATTLPTAALGDGFWSFFGELLCIQTYDPVVVFTSIGTQQSIEREIFGDNILPGGEYFWTFGTGFAVNPRVTLSTRFIAEYISDTYINGDRVPGTAQEPMSIRLAATIAHPDYFVEPFVQFGTNDDAVDTLFGVVWTY